MPKKLFSYFSIFGLFCCFASYCGGILLSWFQQWSVILAAQWRLYMNYVNHDFARGLVRRFQGNERMKRREIYMMLAKVKRANFLARR